SFRSSVMMICPRHSDSYHSRANSINGSPVGGSTFVTLAPIRASREAATGPGVLMLRLTTLTSLSSSDCSAMPAKDRAEDGLRAIAISKLRDPAEAPAQISAISLAGHDMVFKTGMLESAALTGENMLRKILAFIALFTFTAAATQRQIIPTIAPAARHSPPR